MRSVPVQSVRAAASTDLIPRIDSIRRAFFAPEPLVILFPRRFSRSTLASGVVGFLSEICTVRLSSLPPFPPLLRFLLRNFPLPSRSGRRDISRKRKWVEAMVLTSFGLVLLCSALPSGNRRCIFYNAVDGSLSRSCLPSALSPPLHYPEHC